LAAFRRVEACDALIADHAAVVDGVAARLGVDRDVAVEALREAKARWVDDNTNHAGDEPTPEQVAAALPGLADGIVKQVA
jgi:hypothetical protein